MTLIGETQGRPQGERVPINIDANVRQQLRDLLYAPDMRGVGYSEFIKRAVDQAKEEIEEKYEAEARQARRDALTRLTQESEDLPGGYR